ncbi:hypothetical protein CO046_04650 [Candidatus Peregrinibacteria bacterium CG_4_9_14_0_2_um_filter_53_11]|nr:MAG: hypothetical protein CO046_04650 [Candidatus Peregrinibacteria bacterium CG_4_9_14_0_2_um_filter_53_11]
MQFKQTQIVKIGSQALFREGDHLDINKINDLAHSVKRLRDERGVMSILVTSGAVALGKMNTTVSELNGSPLASRVAAAVGQFELMNLYKLSLGEDIAQILATHHSILSEERRGPFIEMMNLLLGKGIFPVVNYNDAVDDYEITHVADFTDNDRLAEELASMMKTDRVVILSNVDGFMDGEGKLIEKVAADANYEELLSLCNGTSSKGTGGMRSKVAIAERLTKQGIEVIVGNSARDLEGLINGTIACTHFMPA